MKAAMLAVLAGLLWGAGEVATRSVLATGKVGPITAMALRSTVALPVLIAAYLLAAHVLHARSEPRTWHAAGAAAWLRLVLGSGIAAGALGMLCFYGSLSLGEVSVVKPIAFCVAPATAVALGWLVLGESMPPRKVAGVALILLGVLLLTAAPARAAA